MLINLHDIELAPAQSAEQLYTAADFEPLWTRTARQGMIAYLGESFKSMLAGDRIIYIAQRLGMTVGLIEFLYKAPIDYTPNMVELLFPAGAVNAENFGVHFRYRGIGVGTGLLRQGEQDAASNGYAISTIAPLVTNLGAISLYSRRGYQHASYFQQDPWPARTAMHKTLT